jgi:hypothetical protein
MYVRVPHERAEDWANLPVAAKYDTKSWSFRLDVGLSVKKPACMTPLFLNPSELRPLLGNGSISLRRIRRGRRKN